MIICIIGKSGSGKDTVARLLQEWYGYVPVCSYTTRPIRENETDGIEHYFISQEEAEIMMGGRPDDIVAQTVINNNIYFAMIENLLEADIYVIDPKGVEYIQQHFPDIELFQLYVYCNDDIAMERARKRGDDMNVYVSRHLDESPMFNDYFNRGMYDKVIDNSCDFETMKKRLREMFDTLRNSLR